jgi:transcriptional regulator with XRE-family HTH domain
MNANEMNENEILKKIGVRMKEIRLEQNIKQKELAEKSGLSMFSISQMETGHNTSILSLVQVLKALNRLDMIEPFLKEKEIDAATLARFIQSQQSQRKRVSRSEGFQRPEIRPYFAEEDDESTISLAADDSDVNDEK